MRTQHTGSIIVPTSPRRPESDEPPHSPSGGSTTTPVTELRGSSELFVALPHAPSVTLPELSAPKVESQLQEAVSHFISVISRRVPLPPGALLRATHEVFEKHLPDHTMKQLQATLSVAEARNSGRDEERNLALTIAQRAFIQILPNTIAKAAPDVRHSIHETLLTQTKKYAAAYISKIQESLVIQEDIIKEQAALQNAKTNTAFIALAQHLAEQSGSPAYHTALKALDTPEVSKQLATLMARRDSKQAFNVQQLDLCEHNVLISGYADSQRTNIEVLLGHYHMASGYGLYEYSVACYMAASAANKGTRESLTDAQTEFRRARKCWRKLTQEQKEAVCAPDIIKHSSGHLPKAEVTPWNAAYAAARTSVELSRLYATARYADRAYQPNLKRSISYGDLRAIDTQMRLLKERYDAISSSYDLTDLQQLGSQLQIQMQLRTQSIQCGHIARDTNPGAGHMHYAHAQHAMTAFLLKIHCKIESGYVSAQARDLLLPCIQSALLLRFLSADVFERSQLIQHYQYSAHINIKFAQDHQQPRTGMPNITHNSSVVVVNKEDGAITICHSQLFNEKISSLDAMGELIGPPPETGFRSGCG
ncbi:MAG: hypothetical protein COB66_00375 [Coxiella sp. (in: Bacteria)]|nr:MAG: hypothetical protein COB66_00375 [Coxiella sp. (in: g-proteobacteria)]